MDEIADDRAPLPDVRLPAASLRSLARDGDEDAVRALREVGRGVGETIAGRLGAELDPGSETMSAFWSSVREALAERGLGDADYGLLAPGVAEIRLSGSPESGPPGDRGDGRGCPFTTGLLAGLLSETAGSPVAVLEVACRSREGTVCRFLAGAEDRLRTVRHEILAGSTVEEAVDAA